MSTNANPAPAASVQISPKLKAAISAVTKAEVGLAVAMDSYRNTAKSETTRLALADKKALTAVLFASGDTDARRVSEIVGFVFPASDSARKELDKALAINAKQTDNKKRIAKPVILALQRDKTGKLTLEKAIEEHKAKGQLGDSTRTPGGKTDQTDKAKAKKKTAAEIEEELGNLFAAALNFAKANGYDAADAAQVCEDQSAIIFADDDEDEDEDNDESDD